MSAIKYVILSLRYAQTSKKLSKLAKLKRKSPRDLTKCEKLGGKSKGHVDNLIVHQWEISDGTLGS